VSDGRTVAMLTDAVDRQRLRDTRCGSARTIAHGWHAFVSILSPPDATL
jgi:hypothetical protein